ncbi:Ig kappa chain V-I region Walker [Tupaia chinensis]|uniref:Ig kappa chain V-I region Walker n=1 Tax=Tupaia chinensis TaxID=246437 RepID=L9JAK1_TUPCH|nr:Ig kappa chain V-I region Walker [Tupaia chinensis]
MKPKLLPTLTIDIHLSVLGYDGWRSNYYVDWYQQRPGKGPRFVMQVGPSGISGSKENGTLNHFSGSGSGPDQFLTIQNLQEDDESDYHCEVNHGSGRSYV